jgi:hypothetical protein
MDEKKLISITPVVAAAISCPPATQDIAVNLENRKNAIDTAMYGPLNPAEPNEEYWSKLGAEWNVDAETAKKQRCGNCAVFIQTPNMLSCIESGLTTDKDEFEAIDAAGELGYCEIFDFKCASARTCRAWVAGGPVTEEKEVSVTAAADKRTISQTPAPKKDNVKGSDKNKKGSASGSKKITFDAKTEKAIANKVEEHNKNAPKGRRATLGMLKAVYRRGAGAYSGSHRPGMTRNQWAMGRVNAFLRLLKSGKPKNSAYTTDNDLLPASHPRSSKKKASSMTASGLIPEEQDLAEALIAITQKHGPFDQDGDGVWAGYTPAAENDVADIGVKCSNCVFFQGPNNCQIISLEVEAEGKCRFAVIPEGVVKGYDIPLRDKNTLELLLASAYAEDELSIEIKAYEEYESPEEAIFALTEYSGLGYELEPAVRASWLRGVRNGENPFKRASMFVTMTHDSLDADLLPKGDI